MLNVDVGSVCSSAGLGPPSGTPEEKALALCILIDDDIDKDRSAELIFDFE